MRQIEKIILRNPVTFANNLAKITCDKIIRFGYSYPRLILPLLNAHARIRPSYTDAYIYKTVWISPKSITEISNYKPRRSYGRVKGGSWDRNRKPFAEHPSYKAVKGYFVENNTTPLKRYFEQQTEKLPSRAWGYTKEDSVEERIEDLEKLRTSLLENGYRTQAELLRDESCSPVLNNNEPVPTILNEITVDIGRNGEFLFCGFGAHRLSIAKIEGLEKVPVKIALRHLEWQETRNKMRSGEFNLREGLPHPDLKDIN
ncbi:hypothetical protein ACLI4U_09685 [Natrialbaceae archaeon A-CW2]